MRLLTIVTISLLLSACSAPAPVPTTPRPTAAPAATAKPAPTATPQPDYRAMRQALLTPLGGLIVAMRDRSDLTFHINAFEQAARDVEPKIANDLSKNGNLLHSAIFNTRHGIETKNLQELEGVRRTLLEVN